MAAAAGNETGGTGSKQTAAAAGTVTRQSFPPRPGPHRCYWHRSRAVLNAIVSEKSSQY